MFFHKAVTLSLENQIKANKMQASSGESRMIEISDRGENDKELFHR